MKSFGNDTHSNYRSLSFLNSNIASEFLLCLSQTLNFDQGVIARLPVLNLDGDLIHIERLIQIHKDDWNCNETSWGFPENILIKYKNHFSKMEFIWNQYHEDGKSLRQEVIELETINNKWLLNIYDLGSIIDTAPNTNHITLIKPDREKDCQRFISYAIGCMMGRYSLDEPGLIYAHAGNVGFDASRYANFPADADGIVPLTDELWFTDDAASRVREFLLAVWGADTLEENMAWLAESLGKKSGAGASETPDETIRRYLADKFFKDHLQTYKKRPIYWLFSSGKQGAFQALVYLHRYSEGTLARMRAEHVVPLTGKMQARIAMLQKDLDAASSTAGRNKLSKEIEKLRKKHAELITYDEKLRHQADMRIKLDLDDGVKVNYGKFGDLLEGVKMVTGGAGED